MKISENGLNMIKKFEGYRNKSYRDAVGVWTIGWGTTRINGKAVTSGITCSTAQATEWLKSDCVKFEEKVNKYSKYGFNQNQFDALVSFAYNIGSIDQLTANGTRSVKQISEKIVAYNKAGGKVLAGLTARRKAEQALFNTQCQEQTNTSSNTPTTSQNDHIQLNYTVGQRYTCNASGLRVRTKNASDGVEKIPDGEVIGHLKLGDEYKCYAAARIGDAIWVYLGLDYQKREQWACADNGEKCYIG